MNNRTRKCVGCGNMILLSELKSQCERFTKLPPHMAKDAPADLFEGLLFDPFHKLPGRGCYLHLHKSCLHKAVSYGFMRSFKGEIAVPSKEELLEILKKGIRRRLLDSIRASYRAPWAVMGESAIADAMKADKVDLLVVASDAGESTKSKFLCNAGRKEIMATECFDRSTLGELVGRDSLVMIGFGGEGASKLKEDVQKLVKLDFFET